MYVRTGEFVLILKPVNTPKKYCSTSHMILYYVMMLLLRAQKKESDEAKSYC